MSWHPVIGLEIHAQLATASKIFCGCPNGFGEEPNTNVCPICTGQPGVLPVLNERAVDFAVAAALALNLRLNERSVFARKHYFYPDLPKAFQISQYEEPYAEHGWIEVPLQDGTSKRIGITRIHMEEDAGKNVHGDGADPHSYVDFNRTGSPLIEIVSEPDMRTPEEAGAYMREIHSVLRYLGVSDADMEKGNFRCDANVSVRRSESDPFGTKTELKNINSFRYVEKALQYEIERQIAVLEDGGEVIQETRLWDTGQSRTVAMRSKEEAHDYRYFPEPDLPPLVLTETRIREIADGLPELPGQKRQRYTQDHGIPAYDAGVLTADRTVAEYFEAVLDGFRDAKTVSNWVMNEVLRATGGDVGSFAVAPKRLASLLKLVDDGTISGKIAKDVFEQMQSDDRDPSEIVEAEGMAQISDEGALEATIDEVIAANPDEAGRLKSGEMKLLGFFMGQVMKATGGKANPEAARKLIQEKLTG